MIGIIGAMKNEVEALKKIIENKQEKTISSIEYTRGTMFGKDVVCAVCGPGKVNASVCAQTMILEFHPDLIINTGVGGSLDAKAHVLDVVVGTSAVEHDMDTSPIGDEVGFISGINVKYIPLSETYSTFFVDSLEKLNVRVHRGIIATGDQFISGKEQKERIVALFGAKVCEMEGGAIAHTCYMSSVPCVITRAISDGADDDAPMSFSEFASAAAESSAKAVMYFIEHYAK